MGDRERKTKAIILWQFLILDLDVSGLKEADLTFLFLFSFIILFLPLSFLLQVVMLLKKVKNMLNWNLGDEIDS